MCDLVGSDAVRVQLENRSGHTMAAFLPYMKKRLRNEVTLGALAAGSNDQLVWNET